MSDEHNTRRIAGEVKRKIKEAIDSATPGSLDPLIIVSAIVETALNESKLEGAKLMQKFCSRLVDASRPSTQQRRDAKSLHDSAGRELAKMLDERHDDIISMIQDTNPSEIVGDET